VFKKQLQLIFFAGLTHMSLNTLHARLYNYADMPLGERAAGMGMTSVASSSDVGDAYINPAAVADLHAPMIGASVSSYTRIDARTGDYVGLFDSVKDSLVRGSVESTPAFVGGNFNTKGWVWGGGIVMPSTLSFNGTLTPSNNKVVSYSAQSRTTQLLAFVSKRHGSFSYGASLAVGGITEEERFFKVTEVEPNVVQNTEYYYSLNALTSAFGVVWDAAPGWRFGFSTSVPVMILGGDGSFNEIQSGIDDQTAKKFELKDHPFPIRMSLGVEWTPDPAWVFAGDVHFFTGVERDLAPSAPNDLLSIKAKPIANLNLGVQWRGWSKVGLRAGVFSNLTSSTKKFSRYATLQDSVNMLGATMAVYFPTPNGSISLGGFIQGGQGRMADIGSEGAGVGNVPRSIYIYGAVLGSTYLFL
jgi:hypothetical protein